MKTLVIHIEDPSTDFLKSIYEDLKDYVVVSGLNNKNILRDMIKSFDRIIMLGHGSPWGLFGDNGYVIDQSFIDILKDNPNNVYIWCHANQFVERHNLKGFATGMMISEVGEAYFYKIQAFQDEVDESNELFSKVIKESIDFEDKKRMIEYVKDHYVTEEINHVCNFNNERTYIYL